MAPWCDREVCVYQGEHHHVGDMLPAGKAYVLVESFPEGSYARVEMAPDPEFAAELANYGDTVTSALKSHGWCAPSEEALAAQGWQVAAWSTYPKVSRDPGPPPANLDGPPEPCEECGGNGQYWTTSCECSACHAHKVQKPCEDCDGTGLETPMTTAQWEAHAEWVRAGGREKDPWDFSVRRGGIRFPIPGVDPQHWAAWCTPETAPPSAD